MTKEQARDIVGQATAMLKLTVQEHQTIQTALKVLAEDDKKVIKKEKKDKK